MHAWQAFLEAQERELGKVTVDKWLKPLKLVHFDACNIYLEAQDSFQVLWFDEHIRPKLDVLLNNNNTPIEVHLKTVAAAGQGGRKGNGKDRDSSPPKFSLSFDSLDPTATFENFVPSPQHELIYKLLTRLSENQESEDLGEFNPVYLHGGSGVGKTHLLMAAAEAMRRRGLLVNYTRAETFTQHLVSAIRASQMHTFREAYRKIDALIIDDLDVIGGKAATQEEFFHTFNTLHVAGKQIILAAQASPQELSDMEPRLVSRFEWGIVLPVDPPDRETMVEIAHKKAIALDCPLNKPMLSFLVDSFSNTNSITRAIEALLLRTHLQLNQGKRHSPTTLSVETAKHLLSDLLKEEQEQKLDANKIVASVAKHYGIRIEDVLSKSQSKECVLPRKLAMYLCRLRLKMPFTQIGKFFTRDHSTVMSSVKAIEKSINISGNELASAAASINKLL